MMMQATKLQKEGLVVFEKFGVPESIFATSVMLTMKEQEAREAKEQAELDRLLGKIDEPSEETDYLGNPVKRDIFGNKIY